MATVPDDMMLVGRGSGPNDVEHVQYYNMDVYIYIYVYEDDTACQAFLF